ncbi:hypothetical protein PAMP_005648 [Pampus punctatissimus]
MCASWPQMGSIEPVSSPPLPPPPPPPLPPPPFTVLAFPPKSLHLTTTLRMGRKYGLKEAAADNHSSPSSTEREPRLNMDLRRRSGACGEQRQRSTKRMGEKARA